MATYALNVAYVLNVAYNAFLAKNIGFKEERRM
jgi:hypothetical protein